jgi:hypothetical protein
MEVFKLIKEILSMNSEHNEENGKSIRRKKEKIRRLSKEFKDPQYAYNKKYKVPAAGVRNFSVIDENEKSFSKNATKIRKIAFKTKEELID